MNEELQIDGTVEIEFSCTELSYRKIQLRRDGLIGLAGSLFPQTAGLNNCEIDELEVDKEPGEDGLLKVSTDEGRLEAAFKNEQWRIRTNMAGLRELARQQEEANRSVTGIASSATSQSSAPFPMPHPFPTAQPPTLYGVIATIAVVLVVLVLGYFTFEEPIGKMMQARAARAETRARESEIRLIEAKAKEAYRTLEKRLQATSSSATQKLARLQAASQSLAENLRQSTGLSLANLERSPDLTPREIDQLLRKDKGFLRAWNELLNAYASESRLTEYRGQIDAIDAKAKAAALQESDQSDLERLNAEFDTRLRALDNVATNLATVEETLASKRLQEKMSKEARSMP